MKRPGQKNQKQRKPQHLHFMVTCEICTLQFEICGLPCFVFCPGCRTILKNGNE